MNENAPDPRYQLVIFDFDGTLADTYPWFMSIFDEFAIRYKLPRLEQSALDALRKFDIKYITKKYRIPFWKMTRMGTHLKKRMASEIEQIQLVDGMQGVIDELHDRGVRMAVVSSNAEGNVRQVLGEHNAPYFEVFECGVKLGGKKVKFEKILRRTGVAPDRTLSLGDELRDLKASRQAGIGFGAVAWGYADAETLQSHLPDALFEHPDEIIAWIDGKGLGEGAKFLRETEEIRR